MHIVTQFPHKITDEPDMGIPMPDGCRLSARVWMPDDATENPVPAILEMIPYRKGDGTIARDEVMHKYFAGRGYAVVRLDQRGNGDSQGLMLDEYTAQELDDGVNAIAWLAAQDWCDGNVGMMGKSWGGFNCLQVAALAPPALKAIVTVCSTTDRYADDIHYKGGCLLKENFGWSCQMLSYSSRPPDPAVVGDAWRKMWIERLEAEPLLASIWMRHQHRDAYWKHGSICEDYDAIRAAVLSFSGWADNYMNTTSHLLCNLNAPTKGIVGPWVHQYPHQADPAPQIGFLQEALRWWDHWLKGQETGVETDPAYRAYLQETIRPARMQSARKGNWLAEQSWPSPRVTPRTLALTGSGQLADIGDEFTQPVKSPLDCGFGVGSYFPMSGTVPQMPGDQQDDDARSACFDLTEHDDDLCIVGAPTVRLRLKSDKPQAHLAIRLCEIHPDGASNRVTYGVLNLCHRESHEFPSEIPVDTPFDITLPLDQIAYRVNSGMKLRLAISTNYWPFLWPLPEQATVTIMSGELELPVHQGTENDEWTFEEAEGATPWAHRPIRPMSHERTVVTDQTSGEIAFHVFDDMGRNEDTSHGLISDSTSREVWRIHPDDPLCASAEISWTQELEREDWRIRTETSSKMWSDHGFFYLSATISAFEGDDLVFEKEFEDKIERKFT